MKLAIAGKGGVGKTTVAAAFAKCRAMEGHPIVAVDADPDGNLPAALGIPSNMLPTPISALKELIRQRTGVDETAGLVFRLNPKVDDLPDRFSVLCDGVRLLILGTVETAGKGCLCPENAVLKALLQHLLLRVPDDVILDMEAGLEHLGRGSAAGMDAMLVVVEPGLRSVQTAKRIAELGHQIGLKRVWAIANKIREQCELRVLEEALSPVPIVAHLPFYEELQLQDLAGKGITVLPRSESTGGFDRRVWEMLDAICTRLNPAIAQS